MQYVDVITNYPLEKAQVQEKIFICATVWSWTGIKGTATALPANEGASQKIWETLKYPPILTGVWAWASHFTGRGPLT